MEDHQKLKRMGLEVPEEHFYTSALATAAFMIQRHWRAFSSLLMSAECSAVPFSNTCILWFLM